MRVRDSVEVDRVTEGVGWSDGSEEVVRRMTEVMGTREELEDAVFWCEIDEFG